MSVGLLVCFSVLRLSFMIEEAFTDGRINANRYPPTLLSKLKFFPYPTYEEKAVHLLGYIVRRLLQMIPVLIGITLLAFLFVKLLPGDPIMILTGGKASPETVAALHAKFGLDKPLHVQYLLFLSNAVRGDLGTSILQRDPVTDIVVERIGPSAFSPSHWLSSRRCAPTSPSTMLSARGAWLLSPCRRSGWACC
jgi:hypothetical protein